MSMISTKRYSLRTMVLLSTIALVLASFAIMGIAYAKLTATAQPQVVAPGGTVTVTGTADPGAVLVIKLVNPSGTTLLIDQILAGNDGSFTYSIKFPSQPSGQYTFGTYTIVIRNDKTGETQTLSVKFQSGGVVRGVVVDENGNPVSGAKVIAVGAQASATTQSDGSFELFTSPGSYTLKISKAGYVSTEVNVTVEAGKEVNVGTITIKSYDYVIAELKSAIEDLSKSITSLNSNLSSLSSDVENLKSSVQKNSKDITDLSSKLASLDDKLNSLASNLANLEQMVKSINSTLSSELNELMTQVNNLASSKADKTEVEQLRNEINTLKSQAVTRDEFSKSLSAKADAAKVDALSKQLQQLASRIATLEKRVSTLEAATQSLGQLTSTLQSLQNTVNSLQKTVSQIQSLQNRIESATNKASSASSTATLAVVLGIIGIIIAIVAVVLVYKKIAV